MITMIMIIVIVIIFFIADLTKIMLVLGYFLMQCSLARLHCPCQKNTFMCRISFHFLGMYTVNNVSYNTFFGCMFLTFVKSFNL